METEDPAQHRRTIVVVGASAGGIEPLRHVLRALPSTFGAAMFAVVHLSERSSGNLPAVLGLRSALPVQFAENGERYACGRVYVAPPDRHMVLTDGTIGLTRGPRENHARPSVDVLFRSAAEQHGPSVVGVVLSGALSDGAVGLAAIADAGGIGIVQDPGQAEWGSMPSSALMRVPSAHVVPIEGLAPMLLDLLRDRTALLPPPERTEPMPTRESYGIACPDCHGILHEHESNGISSFVCRVGHRYSIDALLSSVASGAENAIWMAVRALEEKADLNQRVAQRLRDRGADVPASRFASTAHEAGFQAELIRRLLSEAYTGGDIVEAPRGE